MSFMLTTDQILSRQKTVTRRLGWWNLKPGDLVQAVEKGMGLKKGEKINRIGVIRVVNVRREPLQRMLDDPYYGSVESAKEGYAGRPHGWFVSHFCKAMRCTPQTEVNRIEFDYVRDGE